MSKTDQEQLDRLVDGELSEDERRRLLESFEGNPEGWRQCACAFLEAQEFRTALADYLDNDSPTLASRSATKTKTMTQERNAIADSRSSGWWLALAACLLLGFALGQFGADGDSYREPTVASETPSDRESRDPMGRPASDPLEAVVVHDPFAESILEQQYSAIPSDIEDVLDRLGQRVERRQIFVPVRSRDGQTGTVPVEEIEIVPVRMDTY